MASGFTAHLRDTTALVVPLLSNTHNVAAQMLPEQGNHRVAGHRAVHHLHSDACSQACPHRELNSLDQCSCSFSLEHDVRHVCIISTAVKTEHASVACV